MAPSARRDPLRELALLVRAPEPGARQLGEFLADHAQGLAPVLAVDERELAAARALDDEALAPRILALLRRARDRQGQQDLERQRARSLAAAARLGETARWTELGAELDVDVLLGDILADRTMKWVGFVERGGFQVVVARPLVAATVPLRRLHLDVAAYVDGAGLHVRWRCGRGGYNWHPRPVDAHLADSVLSVPLAPRPVRVPQQRRDGAWLGDVLQQLGYVT